MYKYKMVVTVPTDDVDKYRFGPEWKKVDTIFGKKVDNMFTMEFYVHDKDNPERELKHVIRDLMPFVSKDPRYLLIHQALWKIIDTTYSARADDEYGAIAIIERFEDGASSVTKKMADIVYGIR